MTTSPALLLGRAADGITLRDALAAAPVTGAVALLSTPAAYVVATVDDDHHCITPDKPAPLEEAFEARVFTPDSELRWTATGPGTGRAVVLTEDPALLPAAPFTEEIEDLRAIDTVEARYLLWGRPVADDRAPVGWTTLHTPRIGTLRVPAPRPGPQQRIRLAAREYVCAEARHGNAYVADERLLRLEATGPERRGRTDG
ncbi:type III-D CRISPR-associated protein Csx19 [Streptomyces albogriseolus]|uniref:type III-D CRISPR-associated protein Csx19 n=1 Tax=Streptomyces albogriseolus TaxID=1887 RepID=UPI003CFBB6EA